VDRFIANSEFVKQRIQRYYGRQAVVMHPPVDTEFFTPGKQPVQDYYLSVSALVPYKRMDLLVTAFNELKKPLIIVGKGSEEKKLRRLAGKTIEFKKDLTGQQLLELYQQAKAFVFGGVEDFGIAFAEALACGIPVIAPKIGGVLDIVTAKCGYLYEQQTKENVMQAVLASEQLHFEKQIIRQQSLQFSIDCFKEKFQRYINTVL
jgi:glycosyltransferase involved in cell wall biosynthesis